MIIYIWYYAIQYGISGVTEIDHPGGNYTVISILNAAGWRERYTHMITAGCSRLGALLFRRDKSQYSEASIYSFRVSTSNCVHILSRYTAYKQVPPRLLTPLPSTPTLALPSAAPPTPLTPTSCVGRLRRRTPVLSGLFRCLCLIFLVIIPRLLHLLLICRLCRCLLARLPFTRLSAPSNPSPAATASASATTRPSRRGRRRRCLRVICILDGAGSVRRGFTTLALFGRWEIWRRRTYLRGRGERFAGHLASSPHHLAEFVFW